MTSKLILPQEIKPKNSQWGYGGQLSTAPSTATISPDEVYEAWPMSAAKVGVGMLTGKIDPREVWQGLKSSVLNPPMKLNGGMTPEQAAEKGIEGALSFSPGNIGIMGGLLGGAKAIARPTGLSGAVEMASKGHNVEDIWQKTGWIKGKEGKWRFEIDDSMADLNRKTLPQWHENLKKNGTEKLENIFLHDSLYRQYPEMKDILIQYDSTIPANGYFTRNTNTIVINPNRVTEPTKLKKTLIHEIQHAIQEKEGFARGGSPSVNTWANSEQRPELLKVAQQTMAEWKPATYEQFWGKEVSAEGKKAYGQYLKEFNSKEGYEQRWRAAQEGAPARIYKSLYGEFESRDSASRLLWDKEKRGLIRPYSSEVEPQGGWILR